MTTHVAPSLSNEDISHVYGASRMPYLSGMTKDSLNRRLRYERPQPCDGWIAPGPRDFAVFEALRRHGPLPTQYLFEFSRHLGGNFTALQHRLTKLYNGAGRAAPLLIRPQQQFASYKARYQPLVYDLAPPAQQLLAERGKLERTPERADHFLHRLMGACVSASIELACREQGLSYISLEQILEHGKIDRPRPLSLSLAGGRSLIPDGLFGIQYRDRSYRFFAVEVDRNTESIERTRLDQSGFGRKLRGYAEALSNRTYKTSWGIPSLLILTVTTSAVHLQNIVRYTDALKDRADHFLFKTKTEFGTNWEVPDVMRDLLTESWTGVAGLTIDRP
jgi:hypothetical protein